MPASRAWPLRQGVARAARSFLVLAIVAALIGGPGDGRPALAAGPTLPPDGVQQTTVASPSAALQLLLVEHVYLMGFLAKTILDGQQVQVQPSLDAVDANARALADLVGAAHG